MLTAMGGWVYIMANQRNGTLGRLDGPDFAGP